MSEEMKANNEEFKKEELAIENLDKTEGGISMFPPRKIRCSSCGEYFFTYAPVNRTKCNKCSLD